jgi:integrase
MLTAKFVEQVKCPPHKPRDEIRDTLLTGLGLIVQNSGHKSWAVRYRHAGRTVKHTLGPYPALDLAKAREEGKVALQLVAKGMDPAASKKLARQESLTGRDLVKNVVSQFIDRHAKRKRSWPEIERMFKHDVLPYWGERRIQEISRRDVIELMDRLTDRGVGTMTNRVFSIVRKLFNWAISRDIIDASPCARLKPPVPEVSRDRVLNDNELRWFWKATTALGYPFGPLFQLLLITGQRLSEVGEAKASEINLDSRVWVIPRERVKNNAAHEVPLSEVGFAVIDTLPRIVSKSGYLFTTTGQTPVSGWSRAKRNLDKAMLAIARSDAADCGQRADTMLILAWRLHDLRRTASSGMARLGINLPVIEKVLNHTSGSFAGIVGVYQRHSYSDEKRAALETWGRFITTLSEERPADNVVTMRR